MQGLADWFENDADDDVVLWTILVEDNSFGSVEVDEAEQYHDAFDLPFPVLADTTGSWGDLYGDGSNGQHVYVVVDSEGVITWRADSNNGSSLDAITTAVEAAE